MAEQETAKARLNQVQNKDMNKAASPTAFENTDSDRSSATAQLAAQLLDEDEYTFIEESESFAAENQIEYGEKK